MLGVGRITVDSFPNSQMLKREDYIFTVGYDGDKAIVDKLSKSTFGKLSARELADKGLFRAAYLAAIYDADSAAAEYVLEKFNSVSPHRSRTELNRVLGAQPPSENITGVRTV